MCSGGLWRAMSCHASKDKVRVLTLPRLTCLLCTSLRGCSMDHTELHAECLALCGQLFIIVCCKAYAKTLCFSWS